MAGQKRGLIGEGVVTSLVEASVLFLDWVRIRVRWD